MHVECQRMDVYAEEILDHYRHPRGKALLSAPTVAHEEVNLSCGDALMLHLQIAEEKISALGWDGSGCAISQAAMSMLGETLVGKTVEKAAALSPTDVYDLLGVPIGPRRVKCALLSLHTLNNAMRKIRNLEVQGWSDTARGTD